MKKSLVALAALAVVGAASAQSTVTIYGRLDAGYSANTTTTTTSSNTGAVSADTRNNGVNNNGLATSYWGIRGSEDLGGGMRANFNLEQDVGIDSGVTGTTAGANVTVTTPAASGFNRISTLGLSGGFGSVMVGRFYNPIFLTTLASDVFGAGGAYTVNLFPDSATLTSVRASDAVFYTTPNMGGFSATIMLGRNDTGTTAAAATSGQTGLSGTYAAGPLLLSAAMHKTESTVGTVNLQNDGTAFTATYDFGAAKVYGGYIRAKFQADTSINTYTERSETNLGVSVPFGAATLMAAYGRNTADYTTVGVTDGQNGSDFIVGATYDLSKRTALYFKTGVYNRLDNTATLSGTKTQTTSFGMRHLF